MPAWSLPGPILLALTAPAAGDRDASPVKGKVRVITAVSQTNAPAPMAMRLQLGPVDSPTSDRGKRLASPNGTTLQPVNDPQADSVRALLRDRQARRSGAVNARVEWRLSGDGSDVGLGGGLARVVDTLLHD